jgi:REP-associated tyrosine transposase
MRDRRRYLHWVFEAKKRFGLCVLDYMVTSNHVHLLLKDTGPNVIPQSMQLIAGRTAQEYNQRKARGGAFREDRYHATAIQTDEHLHQCLVYIDLNMVRAGVVNHPIQNVLQANTNDLFVRDDRWSEEIAVGSLACVEQVKSELGVKALHRADPLNR